MVGYIPAGAEGVDGSVSITAFLDINEVAITDTVENGPIEVNGYDNGTDTNWIDGRTVITADEWNSFATSPLSFKVRVEANEGIWVQKEGTIASCPNCKFIFSTEKIFPTWTIFDVTPTAITNGYSENYKDIIASTGKNYFLGLVTNNNNQVTRAFACGLYNGLTPFCVEGTSDGSKFNDNIEYLNNVIGEYDSVTGLGCSYIESPAVNNVINFPGTIRVFTTGVGSASSVNSSTNGSCAILYEGSMRCT